MEWEKIYTNHISDKELTSKIHKELLKVTSETKTKQSKTPPNQKSTTDLRDKKPD